MENTVTISISKDTWERVKDQFEGVESMLEDYKEKIKLLNALGEFRRYYGDVTDAAKNALEDHISALRPSAWYVGYRRENFKEAVDQLIEAATEPDDNDDNSDDD